MFLDAQQPRTRALMPWLRKAAVALPGLALFWLAACALDHEEEVRAKIRDWVRLGDTLYFYSKVDCTAALFDLKGSRITSHVTKVRSMAAGMRAISNGETVAFEVSTSPNHVTEDVMTADLPMGLGLLTAGTSGKDCMAREMEVAYFNALLDPTSVLIYEPTEKFIAIFDRRNTRLFFSRGRRG